MTKFIPKYEGTCDGCEKYGMLYERTYQGESELLCKQCIEILRRCLK